MIIKILLPIIFVVLAVVIVMGKGDKLIAGYNTASEEERQKVNIGRLRVLTAIVCLVASVFCALMAYVGNNDKIIVFTATGILFIFLLVVMILANTWVKRK